MFDLNEVPSAEPRKVPLYKIDHTNGSKLDTVSVSVSPAVSPRKQQRRTLTHDHHQRVGNDDEDMANSSSDHIRDDRNSYNKSLQSARCNSHVDVEDDDIGWGDKGRLESTSGWTTCSLGRGSL